MKPGKLAVCCGNIGPMHLGHEALIRAMMARSNEFGDDNHLLIIGSSNAPFTLRHIFSYEERRNLVRKIFPDIPIMGLGDYPTDREWIIALEDLIEARGFRPENAVYFGGCEEDISFFHSAGKTCEIVNRFDGSSPKISATEVRDRLIRGASIDDLVNPVIAFDIETIFKPKWERLKRI